MWMHNGDLNDKPVRGDDSTRSHPSAPTSRRRIGSTSTIETTPGEYAASVEFEGLDGGSTTSASFGGAVQPPLDVIFGLDAISTARDRRRHDGHRLGEGHRALATSAGSSSSSSSALGAAMRTACRAPLARDAIDPGAHVRLEARSSVAMRSRSSAPIGARRSRRALMTSARRSLFRSRGISGRRDRAICPASFLSPCRTAVMSRTRKRRARQQHVLRKAVRQRRKARSPLRRSGPSQRAPAARARRSSLARRDRPSTRETSPCDCRSRGPRRPR